MIIILLLLLLVLSLIYLNINKYNQWFGLNVSKTKRIGFFFFADYFLNLYTNIQFMHSKPTKNINDIQIYLVR